MNKKKISKLLLVMALALLLIVLIGVGYGYLNREKTQGGMILDENAEQYDPEASLETDGNGIAIPGYGVIYFPENETDVQITLYNPEQNTCLFQFELYIDDESQPIASTDLVEPGKAVSEVTLSRALEAGTYTLSIKVLTYAVDTFAPLNNAMVRTQLSVLADE